MTRRLGLQGQGKCWSPPIFCLSAMMLVAACEASENVVHKAPRIFVEFTQRPDAAALQSLAAAHGLRLTKFLPSSAIAVFTLIADHDPAVIIEQLKHESTVTNAELDQQISSPQRP